MKRLTILLALVFEFFSLVALSQGKQFPDAQNWRFSIMDSHKLITQNVKIGTNGWSLIVPQRGGIIRSQTLSIELTDPDPFITIASTWKTDRDYDSRPLITT